MQHFGGVKIFFLSGHFFYGLRIIFYFSQLKQLDSHLVVIVGPVVQFLHLLIFLLPFL